MRSRISAVGLLMMAAVFVAAGAHADVYQFAGNGHCYGTFSDVMGWNQARAAAERTLTIGGHDYVGHLATFATAEEWDFYRTTFSSYSYMWLGGVQQAGAPEPAGGWSWITGEAWGFTAWGTGEPNNYLNNEWALQTNSTVTGWNDAIGIQGNYGFISYGYVVEWDSPIPDPPSPATPEPASLCLLGCSVVAAGLLKRRRRAARAD